MRITNAILLEKICPLLISKNLKLQNWKYELSSWEIFMYKYIYLLGTSVSYKEDQTPLVRLKLFAFYNSSCNLLTTFLVLAITTLSQKTSWKFFPNT